ncbi:class F sortase, partial [Streptomyces sp. NPDC004658]
MSDDHGRTTGTGRLVTGLAWALLLFGLWLWGRGVSDVPRTADGPARGDVLDLGRAADPARLPRAARPLADAV